MNTYSAPLYVDLDVTLACNMKCRHCNVAALKPLDNEFSLQEIRGLIDEMFNIGVYNLSITGGEPLMRKDWKDILLHAHEYPAWLLVLNTNGTLWSEEDVKFVAETLPHFLISVSIDGYTPETYSILRRTASGDPASKLFKRVIKTVRLLKEYGATVTLNYTVTTENIEYFFDTAQLASDLGVTILALKFFPYGRGKTNLDNLELTYERWSDFLVTLTERKEDSSVGNTSISVACPWEVYLPLTKKGYSLDDVERIWKFASPLMNEHYREMRDVGCNAGITTCAISPDGSVYPCGTVSAKIPEVYCGNVREGGLLKVWETSPFLKKMRSLKLSQIGGHCQVCELSPVCGGGCRARAIVHGGYLTSCDPLCPHNQEGS